MYIHTLFEMKSDVSNKFSFYMQVIFICWPVKEKSNTKKIG